MVDRLGLDVVLADAGGTVAGLREENRQAPDTAAGMKVVRITERLAEQLAVVQ